MRIERFQQQVYRELIGNILPFWQGRVSDEDFGGYYGEISAHGEVNKKADKAFIAHARILWAFSQAYIVLGESQFLKQATRAYEFIKNNFVDDVHGGFFYSLSYDKKVLDDAKNTVAQAYGVYALSAYFKASSDNAALTLAEQTFKKLEQHAHDKLSGGYVESLSRNWKLTSDKQRDAKEHLHLMEAYSELLSVNPDKQVHAALKRLVMLFNARIIDHKQARIGQDFSLSWQPNSSKHLYGHDLEGAWILARSAALLAEPNLQAQCNGISLALIDQVIANHGYSKKASKSGVMLGNCVSATPDAPTKCDKDLDAQRHAWVQTEAIMACAFAFEQRLEAIYYQWLQGSWQYIMQSIKDSEYGEWYAGRNADGSLLAEQVKVGPWKCPYHSVRACLRLYLLLDDKALFQAYENQCVNQETPDDNNKKEAS